MKVFIVFERSWRGTYVSQVFSNETEAKKYLDEKRGDDYDLDSAYEFYMQKWEVV